jgi:hypothetical protein
MAAKERLSGGKEEQEGRREKVTHERDGAARAAFMQDNNETKFRNSGEEAILCIRLLISSLM